MVYKNQILRGQSLMILVSIIIIVILFSIISMAQYSNDNISNNSIDSNISNNSVEGNIDYSYTNITRVSVKTKYMGIDHNRDAQIILVNITTNRLGYFAYVEEYYSVDSYKQPKFYSGARYEEKNLSDYNLSFQILRPKKEGGNYYLTKAIVVLDGERVYEKWLTQNVTDYVSVDNLIEIPINNVNKTNGTEVNKSNKTNKVNVPIVGENITDYVEEAPKKSPGNGIIMIFASILTAFLLGKQVDIKENNKK